MFKPFIDSLELHFDFERYFLLPGLALPMKVGKGGLEDVFFHWADWGETCMVQAHLLRNSPRGQKKLQAIRDDIRQMETFPIWIERQGKRVKSNLKELYAAYADPVLRLVLFENGHDSFSVSFAGPKGPFMDALGLRWLKREVLLNFIFLNLMDRKIPFRGFRLRYDKAIVSTFAHNSCASNIFIQQLLPEGILFKIPREVLLEWLGVNRFHKVNPRLDFASMKQDFLLFSPTSFQIEIGRVLESFLRSNDLGMPVKAFFPMFLTWDKFIPIHGQENFMENVLRPFLDLVRKEMAQQLQEYSKHLAPTGTG